MAFTDRMIAALRPKATSYRVSEGGSDQGFHVQVLRTGGITWQLQYRWEGKVRYLKLGSYPATSLAEARRRCREARSKIEAGVDPGAIKQPDAHAPTVADLFDWQHERMIAEGKATADEVRQALRTAAEPIIGRLRPADVTPAHISSILRSMIDRGAVPYSNRVRAYLHRAFQIGLSADHDPARSGRPSFGLSSNPVSSVPRQAAAEVPGERVLSWDEIKIVWHWPCSIGYRAALRLMLLTCGQRSTEILGARHDERTGDIWEIPATRTKNRRPHVVPLHPLALEIWDQMRDDYGPQCQWLFPARWDHSAQHHVPSDSLSKAATCHSIDGVAAWTPRDLRRTTKTRMGELGISKDIRDRLQNHARTDVSSKHYDRYDYLIEKRSAVWAWCERLAVLIK